MAIGWVIYWFSTLDERARQKYRSRVESEERHRLKLIEVNTKIKLLIEKFGNSHYLVGKTIVHKASVNQYLNNMPNYYWKKILVEDVSSFPIIKGKVTETSDLYMNKYSDLGKVITIDLLQQNATSYISLIDFEKEVATANDKIRLESLRVSVGNLIDLRRSQVVKMSLWEQYYGGLPSEFYDNMTGIEFERYIENLLSKIGYNVFRTPSSGDQGVDIIAEDESKRRIAIQTKKYKDKVGNYAVQEVAAGRKYYKCSEAWVITNSTFTVSAIQLAKANNVKLIDGVEMIQMFQDVAAEDCDIPEFDEERFNEIKVFAERLYKVRDFDFTFTRTQHDNQITQLNLEIKRLENSLQAGLF